MDDKRGHQKINGPMIVSAALAIVDRDGLPGLSMRVLGNHLGVEGMALYRYFPEKEAILDQVVAVVLEGVDLPTATKWDTGVRNAALSLRERLLLHPNVMPLVASRWSRIPVLRKFESSVIQELCRAGFDETVAKDAAGALMSLILGHAWIEVKGYVGELPDSGGLTRRPVEPIIPDQTTVDQEALRLEFERGLDLLLDGMRAALR